MRIRVPKIGLCVPRLRRNVLSASLAIPLLGLLARIGLGIGLARDGYFFGELYDTFSRASLAWTWSRSPFIAIGQAYWVPFQFWTTGLLYKLVRPIVETSDLLIPVALNHLVFLGSLIVVFQIAESLGGRKAGIVAALLAVTMGYDTWVTFSALSEPITIFMSLVLGKLALDWARTKDGTKLLWMGMAALIASSNHYAGWFLAAFVMVFAIVMGFRQHFVKRSLSHKHLAHYTGAVALSSLFPLFWMVINQLKHANPVEFINGAAEFHVGLAGTSLPTRMLGPLIGLWQAEPIVVLVALVALPMVIRKKPKSAVALLPAFAYWFFLTSSSLMVLSAPYNEPRYSLILAWALVPFCAVAISYLLISKNNAWKLGGYGLLLAMGLGGIFRSFAYVNVVNTELRNAGLFLGNAYAGGLESAVAEELNWTERHTLAVLSGYPDRLRLASSEEFVSAASILKNEGGGAKEFWLLTSPHTMSTVALNVEFVRAVGQFIFVSPGNTGGILNCTEIPGREWAHIGESGYCFRIPPSLFFFGFSDAQPVAGEETGIQLIWATEPNSCWILNSEVADYYSEEDYPWRFLQQLVVNDVVLWSHDVSSDQFTGWQPVGHYIMSTGDSVSMKFRVVAINEPDDNIDWRGASATGVRNISLVPCD